MDCWMTVLQNILTVTGAITWSFVIIGFILKFIGIITISSDSNNDNDDINKFS